MQKSVLSKISVGQLRWCLARELMRAQTEVQLEAATAAIELALGFFAVHVQKFRKWPSDITHEPAAYASHRAPGTGRKAMYVAHSDTLRRYDTALIVNADSWLV